TFLHFDGRAIRFLGLQKVGVVPDAVFQILPGIERVASRSHAANGEAPMLVGRSDPEVIGKFAIFFLFNDYSLDRASLGADDHVKRRGPAGRESGGDITAAERDRFQEETLPV